MGKLKEQDVVVGTVIGNFRVIVPVAKRDKWSASLHLVECITCKVQSYKVLSTLNKKWKCGQCRKVWGVGITGEGKYSTQVPSYYIWSSMLERSYSVNFKNKHPTYKDCVVCDEWLHYQCFSEWYERQPKQDGWHLDKDLLVKDNKIYSPETCCVVPPEINQSLTTSSATRGEYPIGVTYHKTTGFYYGGCRFVEDGEIAKKAFKKKEDAFSYYKERKELYWKYLGNKYREILPHKVYKALISREVCIDD